MDESYIVDSLIRRSKPITGTGHQFLIARLAKNFTRSNVYSKTGISIERLASIEACEVEPSEDEITQLSRALRINKKPHRHYPELLQGASKC